MWKWWLMGGVAGDGRVVVGGGKEQETAGFCHKCIHFEFDSHLKNDIQTKTQEVKELRDKSSLMSFLISKPKSLQRLGHACIQSSHTLMLSSPTPILMSAISQLWWIQPLMPVSVCGGALIRYEGMAMLCSKIAWLFKTFWTHHQAINIKDSLTWYSERVWHSYKPTHNI